MEAAHNIPVQNQRPPTEALNPVDKKSAEAPQNRVILYITRPEETKNCNFWIGLFKNGVTMPQELYEHDNIDEVYYKAAHEGVADQEALLISNTEKDPPEHFYLLPLDELKKSPDRIIEHIYDVLKAMAPKRAGFYFSRDLIDQATSLSLLKKVLLACRLTPTKEFYLFAGKHGVNSILNTALDVKVELEESMDVLVFH
ncbi:hypothetical protein [Pseudobacteriovorax antillogorgiicola]|uniref:Uncharacterized protein n=1 Tax=Pseudobacteriovorax antillogorgiicola TaxID=1513793 RepID=A0A1Y6B4L7_9BACT|nr:hypothetical protein [Pseudobacteriovorax antillogorgiicola]TCS59111.1 hypothetical protein EDD56_10112 [Pseudobacteriovorax antillogorgiicola]SME91696.1 hypothetical protein SAMN06296036_101474 [Pseudobacteriovorax antillogorgiicola]